MKLCLFCEWLLAKRRWYLLIPACVLAAALLVLLPGFAAVPLSAPILMTSALLPLYALGRKRGQGFRAGQAGQLGHCAAAALAADVKAGHGIDLVAPELDTHGGKRLRRIEVENAAADRKLTRALNLYAALIAGSGQFVGQFVQRDLHARF